MCIYSTNKIYIYFFNGPQYAIVVSVSRTRFDNGPSVSSFLALLELMKQDKINVSQNKICGDIEIKI